jgi:hypothetical protein
MLVRRAGAVLFLLTSLAIACSPSSSPASPTCDQLQTSAREEVSKAIEGARACTTDADCTGIAFSSACFDSCGSAVAKSRTSDVDAAKSRVNDAQCKTFQNQGCKLVIPPCVPPNPVKCASGACTS